MADFVLIPWGSAFLRLTEAEFAVVVGRGLATGEIAAPAHAPVAGDQLLTSEELGKRLGVTAEWCEQAAKEDRIPSVRVGRYLRFDPVAVLREVQNPRPAARLAAER